MSAHTPGPWRALHCVVDAEGAAFVATCADAPTWQIAEANARLCAAAPDLLAACCTARAAIETHTPEIREKRLAIASKVIAEAIAKARA